MHRLYLSYNQCKHTLVPTVTGLKYLCTKLNGQGRNYRGRIRNHIILTLFYKMSRIVSSPTISKKFKAAASKAISSSLSAGWAKKKMCQGHSIRDAVTFQTQTKGLPAYTIKQRPKWPLTFGTS